MVLWLQKWTSSNDPLQLSKSENMLLWLQNDALLQVIKQILE